MSESKELVFIAPETALDVYTADKGIDPYLAKIKQEVDGFIPDISTKKGRDAIASMAYKVSQSKAYLDKTGKELVDKLKEQPKLVDATRKHVRDYLDALRDEVRKPLTDWEEAEESRIEQHKQRIAYFELRLECADLDAKELQDNIDNITAMVVNESFEEFELEATRAKEKALAALNAALVKRQAYEAEQAELARLRQEAIERDQREREERIAREAAEAERLKAELAAQAERERVEAELRAEREEVARREAAAIAEVERKERESLQAAIDAKRESDRKEIELKLAAETAKREALEAEQRAERAAQAERDKIAAEQAKEAAELTAREKDKAHKKTINNAAVAAFTDNGMTEECAKLAVTLIAKKVIPSVSINY
jgi:peptidoglycan DL-endopeptidase RipA